ncbi:threonine synthase [uncultured Dubosiella sp.]|uniref:threonine synthase n=1 Tax=uncultured Dubosiella sp. TaxID=1937011 RepID=UPI002588E78F|nr:threonine synthase [uncultured Dubosiella sp.]
MENQYVSTRDPKCAVSAKQAILKGIAPDGGLFVWPDVDKVRVDLEKIVDNGYLDNAVYILNALLGDYSEAELRACVDNAYKNSFASPAITPLRAVGDIHVLELFHGPTSAFKDVALTLLPQLMSTALKTTGQKAMIMTATSGDTGKAAMAGFQDVDNIAIEVFYPHNKVSAMQYRQMATQEGNNVKVFAIEGNFDDAQTKVKELFMDEELNAEAARQGVMLTSANSINVGRLVPQIVYYFEAYKDLVREGVVALGDKVSFSVPTGNFGDVLAGYYASMMGLPVEKFYVASNSNKVLTDFLKTGVYDKNRAFVQTISPSMDILVSSNLERLLYYMTGKDSAKVARWMDELKTQGRYTVDDATLARIRSLFDGDFVTDEQTKETIQSVYEATGIVLDPHTAIGYRVAQSHPERPVVALATASPYKFSMDVLDALGTASADEWDALRKLEAVCQDAIPAPLAALETKPIRHRDVIEVGQMKEVVRQGLEALL